MNIIDLLRLMVEKKASDLHITTGIPPQIRINGNLDLVGSEALNYQMSQELAYQILTKEQIEEFERTKELDFSYGVPGLSRFRVNVYFQRNCVALSIRMIPFAIPSIEELGLPDIIKEFAKKFNGLFLVTGAVGSGKSTTLAAMIDYINEWRSCQIITIEDPIEYLHKHKKATINQREVGTDTTSFAQALRRIFRQDPNIIMIGEMRDLETIQAALTLAETGHLILATLHTIDTIHAISRIIDVFPSYQQHQIRVQLSMVLLGIISQQLVPDIKGQGRVLACEVMNVTPSIRSLVRENTLPQIYTCIQTGKRLGMCTMNQSLHDLTSAGRISWEEASRRATDLGELRALAGT